MSVLVLKFSYTRSIIGKDLNIKHSITKSIFLIRQTGRRSLLAALHLQGLIYKILVIGFKVCCDQVSDSISELLSPATVCTA